MLRLRKRTIITNLLRFLIVIRYSKLTKMDIHLKLIAIPYCFCNFCKKFFLHYSEKIVLVRKNSLLPGLTSMIPLRSRIAWWFRAKTRNHRTVPVIGMRWLRFTPFSSFLTRVLRFLVTMIRSSLYNQIRIIIPNVKGLQISSSLHKSSSVLPRKSASTRKCPVFLIRCITGKEKQ